MTAKLSKSASVDSQLVGYDKDFMTIFLRKIVSKFVVLRNEEFPVVMHAFAGFFFLLMSYFLLLPLRDEAAMSLGTGALPILFALSLFVTLLAAPAASALLSHPDLPKARALLLLYRFFALSLVGFFLLYLAVPANTFGKKDSGKAGSVPLLKEGHPTEVAEATSMGAGSLAVLVEVTVPFLVVRGSFFLWVSLLNLFATSAMWARLADVMTSEAGARLFGFVGAGATLGQLVGSLLAASLAFLGPGLLLLSGVLMEAAARSVIQIRDCTNVHVSPTCHVNATSAPMMPEPRSRSPSPTRRRHVAADNNGDDVRQPLLAEPIIAESAQPKTPPPPPPPIKAPTSPAPKDSAKDGQTPGAMRLDAQLPLPASQKKGGGVAQKVTALWEGLQLVYASAYLLHVCLFLLLNAVISSFFYFERSAIVANSISDPVARRVMFAKINGLSAAATVTFQLTLTGRLISNLGIGVAICASPAVALMGICAVAAWPWAVVVAVAEASRKVINYTLTRPSRELLFTVVSREEKYKAKLCIDTLVQRLGDAMAAGAFKVLGSWLLLGPSGVAACAIPTCIMWLAVAYILGQRQQALAGKVPTATFAI